MWARSEGRELDKAAGIRNLDKRTSAVNMSWKNRGRSRAKLFPQAPDINISPVRPSAFG